MTVLKIGRLEVMLEFEEMHKGATKSAEASEHW